MKRFALLAFLSLTWLSLNAQQLSTITISTTPSGARYSVDGQTYIQPTTFVWPAGSKHLLVFVADTLLPNQAGGAVQTSANGTVQYVFGGWVDNTGLLLPSSDPIQTITADPPVTSMNAVLTVSSNASF